MEPMKLSMETCNINGVDYVRADAVKQAQVAQEEDKASKNYVIVRSRDQGVMCGEYIRHSGREVTLQQARQIWRYEGGLCLPDIAKRGPAKGSRLSAALDGETIMLEACGILPVSCKAAVEFQNWPADPVGT